MSTEHLSEQQSDQEAAAASVADEQGNIYGLPPYLYKQVKSLRYGDAEGLKDLLNIYELFARQILGLASSQVGLSAVNRAVKMREHNRVAAPTAQDASIVGPELASSTDPQASPTGASPSTAAGPEAVRPRGAVPVSQEQHAEIRAVAGNVFDPAGPAANPGFANPSLDPLTPERPAIVKPGLLTEEDRAPGHVAEPDGGVSAPGVNPADAARASEPGWIRAALRYNEQHPELVAEFNELTQRSCVLDGKQADPVAVSEWQRMHGLAPDAKIGPMTVAAARKAKTVAAAPAPAKAPGQEARIDV
ncbi:MAG TPA: hypothetical protein VFT22_16410 [Kofleriaceae bacterium]|nr:hypothetical protein [Kofleriaceae bacterium]